MNTVLFRNCCFYLGNTFDSLVGCQKYCRDKIAQYLSTRTFFFVREDLDLDFCLIESNGKGLHE